MGPLPPEPDAAEELAPVAAADVEDPMPLAPPAPNPPAASAPPDVESDVAPEPPYGVPELVDEGAAEPEPPEPDSGDPPPSAKSLSTWMPQATRQKQTIKRKKRAMVDHLLVAGKNASDKAYASASYIYLSSRAASSPRLSPWVYWDKWTLNQIITFFGHSVMQAFGIVQLTRRVSGPRRRPLAATQTVAALALRRALAERSRGLLPEHLGS